MKKLTDFMDDTGVTNAIYAGLMKLVDEDKALDILEIMDGWRVVINYRSTTRHGQCSYTKKQIELHNHLMKPGSEEGRKQTTIHEIAHMVTRQVYGPMVKSHGKEWKHVMKCFGARPDRCTSHEGMKDFRMQKAKIIYGCTRCDAEMPAMRKKKHPPENYTHNRCGGKLYVKENRVTGYRAS